MKLTPDQQQLIKLVRHGVELMKTHLVTQSALFDQENPQALGLVSTPIAMKWLGVKMTKILEQEQWNYNDIAMTCACSFMLLVAFRKGLKNDANAPATGPSDSPPAT